MTQHGGYTEESQGDSSQSRDPAAVLVKLRLVGILNHAEGDCSIGAVVLLKDKVNSLRIGRQRVSGLLQFHADP